MEPEFYEKYYKPWFETTRKFLSPWSEAAASGSRSEGPAGIADWGKEWTKFFDKMLAFPPFMMFQGTAGPVSGMNKDYWQMLGNYIDLYQEWVDIHLSFSKAWLEATRVVSEKMMSAKQIGDSPDNFVKEGYNVWVREVESRLDSLLKDPNFSNKLAGLLSKFLDIKKKSDSMMESYMRTLNLPTRSEMDMISKELYLLKKKIGEPSGETQNQSNSKPGKSKRVPRKKPT